jgi:2-polyprenyl-6-hydroxyphenyl methylase / 3-demethylubiquinone-9 3-methyltransferase
VLILPLLAQAAAMVVDEAYFHRRRELPRWERIGHPLDTLAMIVCIAWLLAGGPLAGYVVLAVASTLFVTKDEFVHARACSGGEQWLHALLFTLHPVVLAALVYADRWVVIAQLVLACGFCAYQAVYWNLVRSGVRVDNSWYADLGSRWYDADDTPIALLRAEARHRNPWLAALLGEPRDVLDLGCGGGLLANYLAERGHRVTGIDTTAENLAVAWAHDHTGTVRYERGDACALPYPDASFDVVCAMDLLEHVEQPQQLIGEAARVLRPGGLLCFHTFNRSWLANLIVIKGVELFVANAPKDMHVLRLFRTPAEVAAMCRAAGLEITELHGSRPRFTWPLWRMLATGRVGEDFAFTWTRSLALGYTGIARTRPTALRVSAYRSGSPRPAADPHSRSTP